jgi:hypothetical protein
MTARAMNWMRMQQKRTSEFELDELNGMEFELRECYGKDS